MARNSEEILFDPPPPAADARLAYGPEPKQFGDLRLPGVDRLWPLAVVVHGGAWKATYNLIHTGHMCVALGEAGIATWNVEYRSRGDVDGTWPGAGVDVSAAARFVTELVERYPLDQERVVLVGHSAGGQLALRAAKHARLPVVALGAVSDLRESAERVGSRRRGRQVHGRDARRGPGSLCGSLAPRAAPARCPSDPRARNQGPGGAVRDERALRRGRRRRSRARPARGHGPLRADRPRGKRIAPHRRGRARAALSSGGLQTLLDHRLSRRADAGVPGHGREEVLPLGCIET